MSDASMPPLELILRQCAAAAPQPWYPKQYAQQTGISRDDLDPHLERLRLGGFVQMTEWVKDLNQGYVLTSAGKELLDRPRALEAVRRGVLPEVKVPPPEVDPEHAEQAESDRVRDTVFSDINPFVTRILLFANVAVWVVGLALAVHLGVDWQKYAGRGVPIVVLYTGGLHGDLLFFNHEWWRLLTCAFVHIGILHLLLNMISLWFLGPVMERLLGHARYVFFYLLVAVLGSCGALVDTPNDIVAGASGAIWGLMAALVVYLRGHRHALPVELYAIIMRRLIVLFVLNVFFTYSFPGISKGAHFGGALAGALLVMPIDNLRVNRGRRWLALGVICAVTAAGFTIGYRNLEQSPGIQEFLTEQREVKEFNEERMPGLSSALSRAHGWYRIISEFTRQNAERRDRKQVAAALAEIPKLQAELAEAETDLRHAGSFFGSKRIQRVQRAGLNLLEAYRNYFSEAQPCLQKPYTQREEEERVKPLQAKVEAAEKAWKTSLKKD